MESTGVDIKPTLPADDTPDKSSPTVPGVGKLKQSRYEDVWPEDVHAAFMEAVALYPPMGKRRLKYYRVSAHEDSDDRFSNANRAKAFGRCQLIQSYILEKTGKNRSRKQVSSHLQRLKKIHKDNPAILHLFSECSQPPSERCTVTQSLANTISSQDSSSSANVSAARHLKNECDHVINLPNTYNSFVSSSASSYASEASSSNGTPCSPLNLWTDFQDQPPFFSSQEFLSPVPQRCALDALHPSDSEYLSEFQDALLFKDAMTEGFRSASTFNASAFSISMRRHASKFPIQGRVPDMGPTAHFSRAAHTTGIQPIHQSTFHENSMDDVSSPFSSIPNAFNVPYLPFQLVPSGKRIDTDFASEWTWPNNPNVLVDPQAGSLDEILLRYSSAMCQYHPTYPVDTSGLHSFSTENPVPRPPRGLSYSNTYPSTATAAENITNKGAMDFPRESLESYDNLASPLVISPIPVYPISYIHSDIHSNVRSEDRSPAGASHPS